MKSLVRQKMQAMGYTLRKLEDESGLSHVTILNARSDEKIVKCRIETLQAIARVLKCQVKDLFEEETE